MKRLIVYVAAVLLTSTALAAPAKHITSPAEAFGFEPGTDRKLADWTQLVAYFQKLSTESDRIHFEEVGKTTEGRPYITVTISSPDTIAHLDRYKEIQRKLADPRITTPEEAKQLVVEGKTVIVVTCNIHSTEIASSQSATEFAYKLATGESPEIQNILKNVIVVLVPSQNPDGEQLVVDWYKKYLGTPYEGSNPVVLWHHYVGHDDNRGARSHRWRRGSRLKRSSIRGTRRFSMICISRARMLLESICRRLLIPSILISIRSSYRRSTRWAQTLRLRSGQRERQVCCRTASMTSGLRSGITLPTTMDYAS
ncbi:MAG: M14 family zinc carboxypeptidase [Terracidiphilus sp.]